MTEARQIEQPEQWGNVERGQIKREDHRQDALGREPFFLSSVFRNPPETIQINQLSVDTQTESLEPLSFPGR